MSSTYPSTQWWTALTSIDYDFIDDLKYTYVNAALMQWACFTGMTSRVVIVMCCFCTCVAHVINLPIHSLMNGSHIYRLWFHCSFHIHICKRCTHAVHMYGLSPVWLPVWLLYTCGPCHQLTDPLTDERQSMLWTTISLVIVSPDMVMRRLHCKYIAFHKC